MENQQQLIPEAQAALATRIEAPSLANVLQDALKGGITNDNAEALGKILDVCERMQAMDAERQFTAAFVALQTDLPVIVASSPIPNRGKYEKYEDLMHVVGPLLQKHGFTVSFTNDFKDNRVLATCHLSHIAGHTRSNSFAVRTGKADSDTQADCKAATTAKRYAFNGALNLVIRQDEYAGEDAAVSGSPISSDKAQYLRELVAETKSDEAAFLKYAQVSKYEEIGDSDYDRLARLLQQKLTRK